MVIYGTTVISISLFLGTLIGDILGKITGIDSNIGGVGFAMIILLVITGYILPTEKMRADTKAGLQFWQGMYVPVAIVITRVRSGHHDTGDTRFMSAKAASSC